MRNKFLKTLMLSSVVALGAMPMTSCSMFFGESGYMIENIQTSYNEQTGDTTVIITFNDDEMKPITFVIPRGISGVDGVGIQNVLSDMITEEDGSQKIKVTIIYTDKEVPNTEIKIPVGKDGRGVSKVTTKLDETTGDTLIEFEYTDGTKSEQIRIPKGENGDPGVGIDFIDVSPIDPTTNTITLTIFYTDERIPTTIDLPVSVGIKKVELDAEKTTKLEYALKVVYTDDTPEHPHIDYIMLPVPQSTKWISGVGEPTADLGGNGDFYIDRKTGDAYQKISDKWEFFFCMKGAGSAVRYTVSFNPNGGQFVETPTLEYYPYRVNYGEYININEFPQVTKSGYTFEGWYTTLEGNPNGGHFTDLTPVLSDLTLYARWSQNI